MVGSPPPEVFRDKSLDTETPLDVPLSAKFKRSFAYTTVKDRLPVILAKLVDYLYREKLKIVAEYGEPAREELKTIIGEFSRLRNELQTNKPVLPLTGTAPDIDQWNACLEASEQQPRWFDSPWLLVECYLYRRIRQAFEKSCALTSFDPFGQQKQDAFSFSLPAIQVLGQHLSKTMETSAVDVKQELMQFIKMSLWGNKCDLSLSAGERNDQTDDPLVQLTLLDKNILVNDFDKVWQLLTEANSPKVVDIILDNAGFELITDLCLADVLVSRGLADTVRLHTKCIPWFVSDVTPPDFEWTLRQMQDCLPQLAARWQEHVDSDRWKLHPFEKSHFWTLPYQFDSMKEVDPEMFSTLQASSLTIYKGDLNYRKLVADKNWRPETAFREAVGSVPAPLVVLRTLKADVVVGLSEGQAAQLTADHPQWMVSGEFALIQAHTH